MSERAYRIAQACAGKVAFATRALAEQVAARRRRSQDTRKRTQQAYRCPHCKYWHHGGRAK